MFLKGINYDVGTFYHPDVCTRPVFNEQVIFQEISMIRNELHCECIRISGYDLNRLIKTSEYALELGMQVWFSPVWIDATQEQNAKFLCECAVAAEKLRNKYPQIVFVAGCEHSLYTQGFIKGEDPYKRIAKMFGVSGVLLNVFGFRNKVYKKINHFLENTIQGIRAAFHGKISYASGTWEKIDWSVFDVIGINHYRSLFNQSSYVQKLRSYQAYKKPVAVTEFGCCTYEGAEKAGGGGWNIIEMKDGKRKIKSKFKRSEATQAKYIVDLLEIFAQENIDAAFVFTFINPVFEHNTDPEYDFDMASYGIVKPVNNDEGLFFQPKEAFHQLAKFYGS